MIQLITESRDFHYVISKTKFGIQEVISPYFLKKNLTFKHSLDAEINLEEEDRKRFKDLDV